MVILLRKRIHIIFLYLLSALFVLLGLVSSYMLFQTERTYNEIFSASTEDYDYETVQDMVSLPKGEVLPEPEAMNEEYEMFDPEFMLSINDEFKGWLWIPETEVNYPVAQTSDNDKYLKQSFQGKRSDFGSLFLDKDSVPGSRNRVIHGHNMGINRTEMFSTLVNYQEATWAAERKYALFTEPEAIEDSRYQLFAVLNFNINDLDEFNYFQPRFETEEDFASFVEYLKSHSLYETEFFPSRDTLILSTCNRAYGENNRLLVCFGRTDAPRK